MLKSIVSYPIRDKYGKAGYRGNAPGGLFHDLLDYYQPKTFCDLMIGGGTSVDVVRERQANGSNIEFHGLDLHSGFNALRDSLTERIKGAADYTFIHPPYFKMIRYSGSQWGTRPHPDDLSQTEDYEEFLMKMAVVMKNNYEAIKNGGNYSILIGDYKKDGNYISIQSDLLKLAPGALDGIIIKQQHNCVSDRKTYANESKLIRIEHEYILNFRKPRAVFGLLDTTLNVSRHLEMLSRANWSGLIRTALNALGGKAALPELYETIEKNAPHVTAPRKNWRERVRSELQTQKYFTRCERGVYAVAGAGH